MILYCDTVNNFVSNCDGNNPVIGQLISDKFKQQGLCGRGKSELLN